MGLLDAGKKAFGYTPVGFAYNKMQDPDIRSGYAKGGLPGAVAGHYQGKAKDAQEAGINDAQTQLAGAKEQAYTRRMQDLQEAMKFYQPVAGELKRLYGMEMPTPSFGGVRPAGQLPGWMSDPNVGAKLAPFTLSGRRAARPVLPGAPPPSDEPRWRR